jgi:hypothetical protein
MLPRPLGRRSMATSSQFATRGIAITAMGTETDLAQLTLDRFGIADTLHRYVSGSIIMTQLRWLEPSPRFIKLLNDSNGPVRH